MRRLRRQVVLGIVSALIGLVGVTVAIVFLCFGLFFWLSTLLAAPWAAAAAGAAVLVAAAIVVLVLQWIGGARSTAASETVDGNFAVELGNLLGREARGFATRHSRATVATSLALGFAIGVSPGLRDAIRRAL